MKQFLKYCVVVCAGVLSASTAGAEITLKLSHYLPPVHGIHADFIDSWTKDVSACAGGKATFEVYPGGTSFGNVAKQQEQVFAGIVDIAVGLHGIPRGRFPRTSIIDMPFLTRDADAASRTLWDLHQQGVFKDEYKGLKVLALFAHNGGLIHTAGKKVETMDDLKGLRIRTPSPAVSEMLTYLGAIPQGLPPGQVYESLQKGVMDGTVFPWDPVASFGLNEVLDYHLDAGSYTVSFFFVMNQRKYNALAEHVRKCLDQFSGETLVKKFGPWWNKWDDVGRKQARQAGHEISELAPEERERWRAALRPMIQSYLESVQASGVDNAEEIYREIQKSIAKYER